MLLEELRERSPGFATWSALTALESVDLHGVLGPDPVASLSHSDCCALTAPTGLTYLNLGCWAVTDRQRTAMFEPRFTMPQLRSVELVGPVPSQQTSSHQPARGLLQQSNHPQSVVLATGDLRPSCRADRSACSRASQGPADPHSPTGPSPGQRAPSCKHTAGAGFPDAALVPARQHCHHKHSVFCCFHAPDVMQAPEGA